MLETPRIAAYYSRVRIAPLLTAVCLLAFPALAPATTFSSFDGFDVNYVTGGLAKNVTEGLWAPDSLSIFVANGLPISIPRDARGLVPIDTLERVLFDETGKAIGFWFGHSHAMFNTYFTVDPQFEFPFPGHFETLNYAATVDGDAQLFFDVSQRWVADDPMAFDAWYRSEIANIASTPEPGTALLLGLGILGVGLARRN